MAVMGRSYTQQLVIIPNVEWPIGRDVSTGATLQVTAAITASGIVGGPSTSIVANYTAVHDGGHFYRSIGKGFPNRPVYTGRSSLADAPGQGNANLPVTVTIAETDTAGGSSTLTVTASITAAGSVVTAGPLITPYIVNTVAIWSAVYAGTYGQGMPIPAVWSRSSTADQAGGSGSQLPVTVTITETDTVGDTASLQVTASITAAGILGLGPEPFYVVNTQAVATGYLYRTSAFPNRPVIGQAPLIVAPGQGQATLQITATITAAGNVATSSGASLTVTVGESAAGTAGGSSSPTWTVSTVAAGAGTGAATQTVTVGFNATGTLAATGTALLGLVATIVGTPTPVGTPPYVVSGGTGAPVSVSGTTSRAASVNGTASSTASVR